MKSTFFRYFFAVIIIFATVTAITVFWEDRTATVEAKVGSDASFTPDAVPGSFASGLPKSGGNTIENSMNARQQNAEAHRQLHESLADLSRTMRQNTRRTNCAKTDVK